MNPLWLQEIVHDALNEDIGQGDLTTEALIPAEMMGEAIFLAKGAGVVAGHETVKEVYRQLDPQVRLHLERENGDRVEPGMVIARAEGSIRSLLIGERVALNFLQRLSGIASMTRGVVDQLEGLTCRVLDTRKTTPGLRLLEKAAVYAGGGVNHRFGLGHGVMIKDNHIAAAGSLSQAVKQVRSRLGHMVQVEVEADTLEQVKEALSLDVDAILLDNMNLDQLREAVHCIDGRVWTEASGGITPTTAREIAQTGVNGISLGWLTHSPTALDISLDLIVKKEVLS
ncbi:nicotinate-nucleotide pyrophosphorylase [carboxylating] [Marininema mesophilum]|uniref:Probable nicotinate-nucleotide pyrophosphorylase [carboxylating] n=1 Tax=Marininema mesophilum TaxID=1048340 RepID=A0A1H3BPD5_9BACL|nr:carboxylating nicotinate-nucleotide diphosphorylase [Marininema mesophilum]SDX43009.1 nicotinate-nucleotide pyrophosphorylase [carboxylating] [Marininema mesophilum]